MGSAEPRHLAADLLRRVLLALGRDEQARTVRWIALIGAIVSFAGHAAAVSPASTPTHRGDAVRREARPGSSASTSTTTSASTASRSGSSC